MSDGVYRSADHYLTARHKGEEKIPPLRRARGHRLYGLDGRRYIDMYQAGGTALLGHRPEGWTRVLKSTGSRGLFAPYPSFCSGKARKNLLSLFPGACDLYFFPDLSSALLSVSAIFYQTTGKRTEQARGHEVSEKPSSQWGLLDPLFFDSSLQDPDSRELDRCIPLWRPFALEPREEDALFTGERGRFFIPLLPLPVDFSPVVLVDTLGSGNNGDPGNFPPSSIRYISPVVEDLVIKMTAELKRYPSDAEKELWAGFDIPGIERKGPYIRFSREIIDRAGGYNHFFARMLAKGVLLPPTQGHAAIVPLDYNEGEVKPLIREVERLYANR